MNKKIKQFIEQFEIVFHTDWKYTKEQIGDEGFEDGETFIESNCPDWHHKDSLIEYYLKLKETYSDEDLQQFLFYFKEVFDTDWEYSKDYFCEEMIDLIASNGTFLHPKLTDDELEKANWKNRDLLLRYYELVRIFTNER